MRHKFKPERASAAIHLIGPPRAGMASCHRRRLAVLLGTMDREHAHTVSATECGSRLDAFISRALGCGVRAAKRLIANAAVRVDGAVRPAHFKVTNGNLVAIKTPPCPTEIPKLAGIRGDYLAFIKPSGLHTAHIAGSVGTSLERMLAAQWEKGEKPSLSAENNGIPEYLQAVLGKNPVGERFVAASLPPEPPVLLSRLDAATSGLVLAAASAGAASRFRSLERGGRVRKYYLTVVRGILESDFIVTNALDTADRARTRVLPETAPDPARHTEVHPLGPAVSFSVPDASRGMTLAAVCIRRGARHQIRAHLAHAGFPVVGDMLYGRKNTETPFRLHHARLVMPERSFFSLPPWLPLP